MWEMPGGIRGLILVGSLFRRLRGRGGGEARAGESRGGGGGGYLSQVCCCDGEGRGGVRGERGIGMRMRWRCCR